MTHSKTLRRALMLAFALALTLNELILISTNNNNFGQVLADDDQDLEKLEWWKKTNYYHIYLRSFRDSNGDGNGDLRGVIEKLDYLKEIGVETILMAPFYSSPMKDCGYDIDDYYAINPMFGTMQDFEDLLAELKKRQMRLVVDFVPNHSSDKHPWFECSERALVEPERCGKYKDYYVWTDSKRYEGKYPSNWISVFGGGPAWTWSDLRKQFYLHQFLPQQPDLNFHLPEVREEFRKIARFWMERGADGLRVDSALFLIEDDVNFADEPPSPFWRDGDDPADRLAHIHTRALHESAEIVQDWRKIAQEEFPGQDKVIITESYHNSIPKLLEYYGNSSQDRYADLPFNFELLKLNERNFNDANSIERVAMSWLKPTRALGWPNEHGAMSPWVIWVMGNHDNKRLVNRIGRKNALIFQWLTYMMPGVPVNYYGDELPLHDSNFASIPQKTIDEGEPTRLPFRAPIAWTNEKPSGGFSSSSDIWLPLNADWERNNVQSLLESRDDNVLKQFKALQTEIRKKRIDLFTFGDLVWYENESDLVEQRRDLLALARTHPKFGNVLLLANLNKDQELVARMRAKQQPTAVFGRYEPEAREPPKSGRVILADFSTIQGSKLKYLEGYVLEPLQVMLIEF